LSASGKSSVIATILGLLEMKQGSITIDQLDLSTIPRDTVRERLVTMPQDPLILVGSLRFNVDPHRRATDSDIINVLSNVGLWAVFQERDGLDSEMTGVSLSKGQQQLLSLARAMLQRGKIMLLDEPTSNVDAETNAIIQRLLRDRCSDRTIIKVAHRMDTILDSDVVIVLEQGRVVEVGDPATLLKMVDGRFTKLLRG
jgi:ATP-binding cassette, subfamily C (CFTR/MRP), member 1